jgi:hypothetical protein
MCKIKDGPAKSDKVSVVTGTVPFMAVEVLLRMKHTYRHDLESFLYVLIWLGTRGSRKPGKPKHRHNPLWEHGGYDMIALCKKDDMTPEGFAKMAKHFGRDMKIIYRLCRAWRYILFPPEFGSNSYTTPDGDPDNLYRPMLQKLDWALRDLESLSAAKIKAQPKKRGGE